MDLILQAVVGGILIGIVYALIATGLTIIFGVMRIVNFAHGEMVMMGMYVGFGVWTYLDLGSLPGAVIAGILLFGIGYALQRGLVNSFITRPQHSQFILFISFGLVITGLHLLLFGPTTRSVDPFSTVATYDIGFMRVKQILLHAALIALVMMGLLWAFLRYTITGKSIQAAADNQTGALVIGIRVSHIYAVTAGIGMACAGAAGAMVAPVLNVDPVQAPAFTLIAFIVVIIGGLGSLPGALLGGILIGVAEALAASLIDSSMKSLFSYALLILVILLRPEGLFGLKGRS